MRVERKLLECEPDDPDRCQADGSGGEGQCRYLSVGGLKKLGMLENVNDQDGKDVANCPKHGGLHTVEANGKRRLYDYRLQVWQERLDEFSESDNVKSLRGEIAVLRLITESILLQCNNQTELVMYSTKLADLVMKIDKLVNSCNKLESSLNMILDQAAALMFASQVVDLIRRHVPDQTAVDEISNGIIDALNQVTTQPAYLEHHE